MKNKLRRLILVVPASVLATALLTQTALASSFSMATAALTNAELDGLRGGVLLPNGFDVAIGVDIQTRVNGELALHTVLYTDKDAEQRFRIFTNGMSSYTPPEGSVTVEDVPASGPDIMVFREGTGTTVSAGSDRPVPGVTVTVAPFELWTDFENEVEVSPQSNGPGVESGLGIIRLEVDENSSVVSLTNPTLLIRHVLGQATGVTIANTANDRNIQTDTSISLDLRGVWPIFSNNLLEINNIAADAAALN